MENGISIRGIKNNVRIILLNNGGGGEFKISCHIMVWINSYVHKIKELLKDG